MKIYEVHQITATHLTEDVVQDMVAALRSQGMEDPATIRKALKYLSRGNGIKDGNISFRPPGGKKGENISFKLPDSIAYAGGEDGTGEPLSGADIKANLKSSYGSAKAKNSAFRDMRNELKNLPSASDSPAKKKDIAAAVDAEGGRKASAELADTGVGSSQFTTGKYDMKNRNTAYNLDRMMSNTGDNDSGTNDDEAGDEENIQAYKFAGGDQGAGKAAMTQASQAAGEIRDVAADTDSGLQTGTAGAGGVSMAGVKAPAQNPAQNLDLAIASGEVDPDEVEDTRDGFELANQGLNQAQANSIAASNATTRKQPPETANLAQNTSTGPQTVAVTGSDEQTPGQATAAQIAQDVRGDKNTELPGTEVDATAGTPAGTQLPGTEVDATANPTAPPVDVLGGDKGIQQAKTAQMKASTATAKAAATKNQMKQSTANAKTMANAPKAQGDDVQTITRLAGVKSPGEANVAQNTRATPTPTATGTGADGPAGRYAAKQVAAGTGADGPAGRYAKPKASTGAQDRAQSMPTTPPTAIRPTVKPKSNIGTAITTGGIPRGGRDDAFGDGSNPKVGNLNAQGTRQKTNKDLGMDPSRDRGDGPVNPPKVSPERAAANRKAQADQEKREMNANR